MENEKYKELIDFVKGELDKIKTIEDEKVKEVITNVNSFIEKFEIPVEKVDGKDLEKPKEEEKKDETDEEKKTDEKSDVQEEKEEKSSEESTEQDTKKTETVEEKEESKAEDEPADVNKELSKAIADKLNESALELQKLNDALDNAKKDVKAKEELVSVYKNKVAELEADIKVYKDAEALELKKTYDKKVNTLIELYSGLGISKTAIDINDSFNESQIDKLISDLSDVRTADKKVVRSTKVSSSMELSNYTKKENKQNEVTLKDIMFHDV